MKNQLFVGLTAIAMLAFALPGKLSAQVQTARYTKIATNANAFYEYLPQGYNPSGSEKYPFILFIHGSGEVGAGTSSTLPAVLRNGIPKLINQGKFPTSFSVNGQSFKFIVFSPQFTKWPSATDVDAIINYAIANYKVDPARIYITGLSMGGGVTCEYATNPGNTNYAKRTAAIVSVSGVTSATDARGKVVASTNLPVWSLHNSGDPTVSVTTTEKFIDVILAQNPPPNPLPKKTIFQASGHDAWSKAYDPNYREDGKNVYEWMLQYKRDGSTPAPAPNVAPKVNAGTDITIQLPANAVQLSGSATDSDGSIAKYAWTKVSGPDQFAFGNASSASTTVTNLISGTYVFRLTATDNKGATGYDEVSVIVKTAPVVPPPPTNGTTRYVKVNLYGGTNPYNNNEWNNWNLGSTKSNIASSAFKYTDGTTSAVKAVLSQTTGTSDNGSTYKGGMAPAEVLRHNSYSTIQRTLTISGLDKAKKYDLELYSSRGMNDGNYTIFSVGSLKDTVATYRNYNDKSQFRGVTPDANGQIVVTLKNVKVYNYLNGFVLTEGSSTSSPVVMAVHEAPVAKVAEAPATFDLNPNPVKDRALLSIENAHKGTLKVEVLDKQGAVKMSLLLNKTNNLFQSYLSLGKLSAGEYTVRVTVGSWSQTTEITKL